MPDANGVPTTFEMDGLLTPEDIRDRNLVYAQCGNMACQEANLFDITKREYLCAKCGHKHYMGGTIVSKRTYNPTLHNKKKKK